MPKQTWIDNKLIRNQKIQTSYIIDAIIIYFHCIVGKNR